MTEDDKMSEEINDTEPIKMFGMMLPRLPGLVFRLGGTFIKIKGQANKAGRIFKKELVNQGLDKQTAEELTRIYMENSHIRQYIQNMG